MKLVFRKVDDVKRRGIAGVYMVAHEGLKAGPFTIHQLSEHQFVLSISGASAVTCWSEANAKKAAKAFAALPIDWDRHPEEIGKTINGNPELAKQCAQIRAQFSKVGYNQA